MHGNKYSNVISNNCFNYSDISKFCCNFLLSNKRRRKYLSWLQDEVEYSRSNESKKCDWIANGFICAEAIESFDLGHLFTSCSKLIIGHVIFFKSESKEFFNGSVYTYRKIWLFWRKLWYEYILSQFPVFILKKFSYSYQNFSTRSDHIFLILAF